MFPSSDRLTVGGVKMSAKNNIRQKGRNRSSVNPQGLSEDVADQRPKSELEDNAKQSNTKR